VLETIRLESESRRPDVLVVDPPRAGLHPKVPAQLIELGADRMIFVSCNPTSGARDVAALCGGGYGVTAVRPVDLFPHTPHVEVVFTLERRT
jgi:23S rRNA (uracil1939-C5)-methyltransferase